MPQLDTSDIALQPVDYDPFAFDTGAPPVDYGAAWQGLKSAGSAIASSAGKLFGTPPPSPPPAGREEGAIERGLRTAANWLGEHSPSAVDAAMMAMGPGRGSIGTQTLASRNPMIYNPPTKPPRPFEADYPTGAPADASGRLVEDIEGRPLTAPYVVGRRMAGVADEALSPEGVQSVATQTRGLDPQAVAPRQIAGDAGRVGKTVDPATGETKRAILFDRDLPPDKADMVIAHELAHVLHLEAGGLNKLGTRGLREELERVYHELATNRPNDRSKTLPADFGYSAGASDRELIAEAIRAYMADPNYLKTVAPKTAAAIRAAVNDNPKLRQIIQFNAVPGAIGAAAAYRLIPVDHDPFAQTP